MFLEALELLQKVREFPGHPDKIILFYCVPQFEKIHISKRCKMRRIQGKNNIIEASAHMKGVRIPPCILRTTIYKSYKALNEENKFQPPLKLYTQPCMYEHVACKSSAECVWLQCNFLYTPNRWAQLCTITLHDCERLC